MEITPNTLDLIILFSALFSIPVFYGIKNLLKACWVIIKMWRKYRFRGMFKD